MRRRKGMDAGIVERSGARLGQAYERDSEEPSSQAPPCGQCPLTAGGLGPHPPAFGGGHSILRHYGNGLNLSEHFHIRLKTDPEDHMFESSGSCFPLLLNKLVHDRQGRLGPHPSAFGGGYSILRHYGNGLNLSEHFHIRLKTNIHAVTNGMDVLCFYSIVGYPSPISSIPPA